MSEVIKPKQKRKGIAVGMRLSPFIHDKLETFAEKKGLTKNAVVTIALEKYISEEERREAK